MGSVRAVLVLLSFGALMFSHMASASECPPKDVCASDGFPNLYCPPGECYEAQNPPGSELTAVDFYCKPLKPKWSCKTNASTNSEKESAYGTIDITVLSSPECTFELSQRTTRCYDDTTAVKLICANGHPQYVAIDCATVSPAAKCFSMCDNVDGYFTENHTSLLCTDEPEKAGFCHHPDCGNGKRDAPHEKCDDGNLVDGDGCSSECQPEAICGNGVVENVQFKCLVGDKYCKEVQHYEQCDDGNTVNFDGCSSDCIIEHPLPSKKPKCGNGIVDTLMCASAVQKKCRPSVEECDDGNNADGDGCDATCHKEIPSPAVCGNMKKEKNEQCDDGNHNDGDGCSSLCLIEKTKCGNGKIEAGEQCDDGNTFPGDGCSAGCAWEKMLE